MPVSAATEAKLRAAMARLLAVSHCTPTGL
jgi:hypothetical protein